MKCYNWIIPKDTPKGKLLPWICRMLPQVPSKEIFSAFDKKDVKIDGTRVKKNAQLVQGAKVQIFLPEVKEVSPINIIYEDELVLVVVKPAGMSCQKDNKGGLTVVDCLTTEDRPLVLLCHRLDNPTEGLLILAKNEDIQLSLQEAFYLKQIQKKYQCVVKNTPSPLHACCNAYLQKEAKYSQVKVTAKPHENSKPICTEYVVLSSGGKARLEITLHTGRTHQIRAHMAYLGHPLLGDDKYGDRDFNKANKAKRLYLCATECAFQLKGKMSYLNKLNFKIKPTF